MARPADWLGRARVHFGRFYFEGTPHMKTGKSLLIRSVLAAVVAGAALVASVAAQATPGPYHCHVINGSVICHGY